MGVSLKFSRVTGYQLLEDLDLAGLHLVLQFGDAAPVEPPGAVRVDDGEVRDLFAGLHDSLRREGAVLVCRARGGQTVNHTCSTNPLYNICSRRYIW